MWTVRRTRRPFLDFAGGYTDEDAERHRNLLERAEETAVEDRRERLDRVAEDGE